MKNKRKRKGVQFNEDEIIINPEDIDPSIGRFRNLVSSTVVPVAAKRAKLEVHSMGIDRFTNLFLAHPVDHNNSVLSGLSTSPTSSKAMHHPHNLAPSLYHGIDEQSHDGRGGTGNGSGFGFNMDTTPSGLTTKLGIILPNPAPDVDPASVTTSMMPPPIYNNMAPKSGKLIITFMCV